ncbi:hypothetical protein C3941_17795 [Kaistia algarum]|uniref:MBL fold metallo-hydrolase n=1 Tax=Kaistia algarum TaxID=2083279 RepID=UPI000CE85A61|nr:MBL fold metallo-hydrolase [Kaistia algarum]MCX5516729.1 MBL fold metallo-hydrolase [Kaistia algarum]PPE78621.1 hypothetical protein C3941_17795 [Kaistia algarum]
MAKKATSAKAGKAPSAGASVTVRHYCQGIGDSHLLRFPKAGGGDFWMLIDCGVHSSVAGGSAKMDKVVADIAAVTKNHLDVIVVTHEHTDHVSAFLTAANAFKGFSVGEVWMAWTEDPSDVQARELDKFKQQALAALQSSSQRLGAAGPLDPHLAGLHQGLDALLGFNFGVKGERVRASRDAAAALAKGHVRYFEPGDPPIDVQGVPGLRIYVLGPPRDPALLGLTERASEMYAMGASPGWALERALSSAFAATDPAGSMAFDYAAPFDPNVGTDLARLAASPASAPDDIEPNIATFARERYFGSMAGGAKPSRGRRTAKAPNPDASDQSWRRIDMDWLGVSADLAMQLDDKTNNASLVLAFEFTDTNRVLLFAADAQIGNWLSWQDTKWQVDGAVVTGPDLLGRTVYYKVGHHGSQNATARVKGLELMTSPDLSAFIPTNQKDAANVHWGAMPYDKILAALNQRCAGRVVRADDPWVADPAGQPNFTPSGSIRAIRHGAGLWVEFDLG